MSRDSIASFACAVSRDRETLRLPVPTLICCGERSDALPSQAVTQRDTLIHLFDP